MYEKLREKYSIFRYEKYSIEDKNDEIVITYDFYIDNLTEFHPSISFSKDIIKNTDINDKMLNYLAFHIGLVEVVSYWKTVCSKNIIINAGYIDEYQIDWFKKLYYHGLGEFFYLNKINVDIKDFVNITCNAAKENLGTTIYNGSGNLIPVGGGKDSNVTLELLKAMDNDAFIINPKSANIECSKVAGYDNPIIIKRNMEIEKLVKMNKEGFLNGHTPFSSFVAFASYLVSYISNRKYIVLSNEDSANESNVVGTKINHQYSKSFEFEKDFNEYTQKYFNLDIKYFSFLRPLQEIKIAELFSKYEKYHKVFRSCNQGSKLSNWSWCCNCPKCLFVYIILSAFLTKDKLVEIFGEDLYENKELLNTFIELTGNADNKPFECVGTYEEVNSAISRCISKSDELPYLLQYYKDNYELVEDMVFTYNEENFLDEEFIKILKENL